MESLEVAKDRILKKYAFKPSLCTNIVGAIGEYLVIADLLQKGYEVFYATTRTCSCDLVILNDGLLRRVEIKVHRFDSTAKADILAVVTSEGILYVPELPDIKVKTKWQDDNTKSKSEGAK